MGQIRPLRRGFAAIRLAAIIGSQVMARVGRNNLGLLAAGVAFFGFLAVFPAIGAGLTIWGYFADPQAVFGQMQMLQTLMPEDAYSIISDQLQSIASADKAGAGLGAAFALLFAFWASSKGTRALITALNVAYEVEETRNIVQHYIMSLAFTVGGVIFALLSVAAIAAIPPVLEALRLGTISEIAIHLARWLGVILLFMTGVAALYQWAPAHQRNRRFKWFTPGALFAALVWILASAAFSLYAGHFANYNKTFGSLGAVAALLMWMWVSSYVVCLGAQLNTVMRARREAHRPAG